MVAQTWSHSLPLNSENLEMIIFRQDQDMATRYRICYFACVVCIFTTLLCPADLPGTFLLNNKWSGYFLGVKDWVRWEVVKAFRNKLLKVQHSRERVWSCRFKVGCFLGLVQRAVENCLFWDPSVDICRRGSAVTAVYPGAKGSGVRVTWWVPDTRQRAKGFS